MKKLLRIVVTLCTLAFAVGFWLVGGSGFLKIKAGPGTLGAEETFSQAEGKYITYEVAYPIAACVEEYYSGDPDRVRSTGYVAYDAERQAFVYVVVTDRDGRGLKDLMRSLSLTGDLRAGKDMTPSTVDGTLELMDESAVERAFEALGESDVLGNYFSFLDEDVYMEAYFGDGYGEVMKTMCENLDEILQQANWYCIKDGEVNNLQISDIWICILAAGLSLLIFIIRLLSLFVGGKKKSIAIPAPSGSKMEQFYEQQREWVEEWCEENLDRGRMYAYLSVVVCAAIFVAIGIFVKVPSTARVIAFYLGLGVFLGELIGAMFWYGQKGQSKPGKILKKYSKHIRKKLPSEAEQEIFAEDILATGAEWKFREKTKTALLQGIVGSRYWVVMQWNGMMTIVDSDKLGKIETETISGTVRSGKVRVSYQSYAVRFYYKSAAPKKFCDASFGFDYRDNERHFMELARKRVGENVEFMML